MPTYKIGRSYGYSGTTSYDFVEADSIEEAKEMAWEFAVERVDSWAEEYNEDDE